MRREVLSYVIPMGLAFFGALGIGLALGWSDGALGWAMIGAGSVVTVAWVLLTPTIAGRPRAEGSERRADEMRRGRA